MTTPLYLRQKTENDAVSLLRSPRAERQSVESNTGPQRVQDVAEPRGNAVTGLVWGTVLSIPLWALIGLGVRVLTKAL